MCPRLPGRCSTSGKADTDRQLHWLRPRGDAGGGGHLSNHAAGVVVGKVGTATVTPEEPLASFEEHAYRRHAGGRGV